MSAENTQDEQQSEQVDRVIELTVYLPDEPGKITFPVSTSDTIADISQTLTAITITQHHTSFNLAFKDGEKLDETDTLQDLVTEEEETLSLTLKEAAYTEKTAREHLAKIREIASLDLPSFYQSLYDFSGVAAGASSYSNLDLDAVKQNEKAEKAEEAGTKTKESEEPTEEGKEQSEKPKLIEISDEEKRSILETVDEILTQKPSPSSVAGKPTLTVAPTLRSLHISSWTPASPQRRLRGDLFYLQCQTLEGETFHITAHVSGFFVNNSSVARFDPSLKTIASTNGKTAKLSKSHSLLILLKSLSLKFVEQSEKNTEVLSSAIYDTYNLPSSTFLNNPWLVEENSSKHPDLAKSQENYIFGGLEGADLFRDWNDEYQGVKELPKPTLSERIIRERLLTKTTFDFTASAIKGAMAVVRNEVTPMNPSDDPSQHIYSRNGIFYSLGVDAAGQFAETGGNEAARASVLRDLSGVKCLNRLDLNVAHLCTTIVDYCGQRVVCQTPVPGIFNQPPIPTEGQEAVSASNSIVYGSSEEGLELNADPEFVKKFSDIGEAFHLKRHKAWTKDGSVVEEVVTSLDTKGMKGTDGRDYIIDLYRTTPLDIEFIDAHFDLSKEDSYPHREVTIRHEAVEEWWRRNISVAFKKETEKFEKEKAEKLARGDTVDSAEKPTFTIDSSAYSLNPDAFALTTAPNEDLARELESDEKAVREVSKFITDILLPELVDDLQSTDIFTAIDGNNLSSMLHKQGINVRYLGSLAKLVDERKAKHLAADEVQQEEIAKVNAEVEAKRAEDTTKKAEETKESTEENENETKEETTSRLEVTPVAVVLDTLYAIAIQEMIARAVKNYLRINCESLPLPLVPYVIAHVHNCLLSEVEPSKQELDELLIIAYPDTDLSVLSKSSADVLSELKKQVFIRYRFELVDDFKKSIRPTPMMKEIATKFGIQWKDKKYSFSKEEINAQIKAQEPQLASETDKKQKKRAAKKNAQTENTTIQLTTFVAEDIVALVPVVKDSIYKSTCAEEIWEHGRSRVTSGETEEGLALLNEAISVYEQVYGSIHPDTAKGYGQLSQICAELKLDAEACELSRKSYQILERTTGTDSYESILALTRLAYAESGNNSFGNAVKIYKRIFERWYIAYGPEHPNVITTLSSVAIILQKLQMFKEAGRVFTRALELSDSTAGEYSQMSGLLRFQLGQAMVTGGMLKPAVAELTKSLKIFKATLGLEDRSTKEAEKWVSQLTNYLTVTEQQEKYMKEVESHNAKKARKLAAQQQKASGADNKSKTNGKKKSVSPNPEIAEQSIDEILKFIEGSNGPSKKNKRKGSKK